VQFQKQGGKKIMHHVARLIFLVTTILTLGTFVAVYGGQNADVSTFIAVGDSFSTKTFENEKALDAFMKAYAIEPNNYEILWRISRSYVDIGEHQPAITKEDKVKQLETYQKSLDFAELALKANPNGSMGYTRRAIANGRVALFKGVWDSIDLVKQVKVDCEKAIQLDKENPAAYYVLARTHAKLCEKPKIIRWPLGLSWANYEEARANYEKAIAMRPTFIMYRLDAARTYAELDEYDKAKDQLTRIAVLPTEDEDDNQFRKEAKDLLERIKDK
jgi:tetratricopeptide (TPR) repeat protein